MTKYLYHIASNYKFQLALILGIASFTAILNTSFGAMLKWLTDGLMSGNTEILFGFIILFSIQRFLLPLAGGAGTLVSSKLSNRIESDIRSSWYDYVTDLDHSASKAKNSGELQKKMQEAVNSLRVLLNSTLKSTLSISLEVTSIAIFAVIFIGLQAGALLVLFALVYSLFVISVTKKRLPIMKRIAEADGQCSAYMHDSFINSGQISPEASRNRNKRHGELLHDLQKQKNRNSKKLFIDSAISAVVCSAIAFFTLAVYYEASSTSAGVIVMLSTSLAQMIMQINTLGFNYRNILRAKVDVLRVSEGLEPREKKSLRKFTKINIKNGLDIKFTNFRPSTNSSSNIPPVSGEINIRRGKLNILKGSSGIGKSTILYATRGELSSGDGNITINDVDVESIDKNFLMENMAYVSQDTIIFNESIRQNIGYGNESARSQEISDTLEKVGLKKFSNNLEYIVGEKGGLLSGGEKKRLMIARGLLQDCHLLILDEPFAGLDEKISLEIANLITLLSKEVCVLVVMHQRPEDLFSDTNEINCCHMFEKSGESHLKHLEHKC
ncbi:ATP-binding cassette domain-containing protein [Halomonas caseinilytica]|uniref:ATP-binding cassette domain-containing protein n=1 Tax=Halomonas caseinilytica TaxID=438744 RepID=UPI0009F21D2E|nr:ABC transporter ATP-binding protein [Halomonas caseinilytica]